MHCAAYWRRCLDSMVEMTGNLTDAEMTKEDDDEESESESSETGKNFSSLINLPEILYLGKPLY